MRDQRTGLCECGCGDKTTVATKTDRRAKMVKGQPMRFIGGHQFRSKNPEYLVNDETGCWDWQQTISAGGYGYAYVRGSGAGLIPAHRVLYERHVGPIPDGLQIDHLCRNRRCVNPEHLEPVTPAENTRRGDKAVLTAEQVAAIKASPHGSRKLSREYGVARTTISMIKRGMTWRDVEPQGLVENAASERLFTPESEAA